MKADIRGRNLLPQKVLELVDFEFVVVLVEVHHFGEFLLISITFLCLLLGWRISFSFQGQLFLGHLGDSANQGLRLGFARVLLRGSLSFLGLRFFQGGNDLLGLRRENGIVVRRVRDEVGHKVRNAHLPILLGQDKAFGMVPRTHVKVPGFVVNRHSQSNLLSKDGFLALFALGAARLGVLK